MNAKFLIGAAISALALVGAMPSRRAWTLDVTMSAGTGNNDQIIKFPVGKIMGDFDCDGDLDIAMGGGQDFDDDTNGAKPHPYKCGIFYWQNPSQTGAAWSRVAVYDEGIPTNTVGIAWGTAVATADMDQDGDTDIISCRDDYHASPHVDANCKYVISTKLYWFENPGNANPNWTQHAFTSSASDAYVHDIAIGDIDQDGKQDIVTIGTDPQIEGSYFTSRLFVFFNNGGTSNLTRVAIWADSDNESTLQLTPPYEGLAIGNINSGSNPDIVQGCHWIVNPLDSGGSARTASNWNGNRYKFTGEAARTDVDISDNNHRDNRKANAIADMNNDGYLDILVAYCETTEKDNINLSIYTNPGSNWTGSWGNGTLIGASQDLSHLHGIRVLDVDSNGWKDILIGEQEHSASGNRRIGIYNQNSGTYTWTQIAGSNVGAHEIMVWQQTVGGNAYTWIATANHALAGGTAELRIYRGP